MLDDEAAELLDEHADDNHSEIIRELVKEYYTTGVYDAEQAALAVRRNELERMENELESELAGVREEREQLEEIVDEESESDVEAVARELSVSNPEAATADNIGIRKKAKQNDVDPAVLAEVVREQMREEQREQLSSLS